MSQRSKSKNPSNEEKKSSSSKHKKDKKEKHKSRDHKDHHRDRDRDKDRDRDHHHKEHKSSKKEKKEASSENGKVEIPLDINPNYKPSKIRNHWPPTETATSSSSRMNGSAPRLAEESWIPKFSNQKTKVFSGRKTSAFSRDEKFPSLKDLCIHVLQDNVKHIYECGNLDFYVLKPVLERTKPEDLMRIEEYNPYLMSETGKFIVTHCASTPNALHFLLHSNYTLILLFTPVHFSALHFCYAPLFTVLHV